jgi:hypothetical protein
MLSAIPCAELDRDGWLLTTAAVKRWVGEDGDFYASAYHPWSLQYGENDDTAIEKMWGGIHDVSVGHDCLPGLARAHGWSGAGSAGLDFPPLTPEQWAAAEAAQAAAVERAENDAAWVERYVYVLSVERYVDLETMQMLTETAFKRALTEHGHPSAGKDNAAMKWQMHDAARKVASLTYRPGGERFIVEDGLECLNTWRGSDLVLPAAVTDADVRPWLEHAAYLLPEVAERGMVLDWMAYRLQRIEKANFALILRRRRGDRQEPAVRVLRTGG